MWNSGRTPVVLAYRKKSARIWYRLKNFPVCIGENIRVFYKIYGVHHSIFDGLVLLVMLYCFHKKNLIVKLVARRLAFMYLVKYVLTADCNKYHWQLHVFHLVNYLKDFPVGVQLKYPIFQNCYMACFNIVLFVRHYLVFKYSENSIYM